MIAWTDEQKALRKSLDEHGEALSAGHVEDDVAAVFPREKWDLLRTKTDVLRLIFDEQWGGKAQDANTLVYVLENFGYVCRDFGLGFGVATQIVSMAIPLQKFGSDELKEQYLAKIVDGELITAHAISEPDAGSDATAMSTTATEDGDDFVLTGKKAFCTSGPVADLLTVYAKAEGEGATGISAFLVPADTPGLTVGDPIPKMGLNTSPIGELEFADCRIPKGNLIGKPGAGFFILEHVMTWEILCIFSMMVGAMQHRHERCVKYAKTRKQFGKPIGENQFILGKIVDQKIGLETSRKHVFDTAEKFARKRNVTGEVSMTKIVVSDANVASATSAVQIFGGRGYMRADGFEKDLRDAVGAPIYSGTNEMQRIRLASMLGL